MRTLAAGRPMPARLARATSSASAEASVEPDLHGRRRAARRPGPGAMAPEPVPRSATTDRSARGHGQRQRHVDDLLGLGSGDQHPAVDHQVEVAERPRPEDVLQRLAGDARAPPWRRGGRPARVRRRIVEADDPFRARRARLASSAQPAGLVRRRRGRSPPALAPASAVGQRRSGAGVQDRHVGAGQLAGPLVGAAARRASRRGRRRARPAAGRG